VTSIENAAFQNCTGLTSVISLKTTPLNISQSVFDGVNKTISCLYVPENSISSYSTASNWEDFSCIRPIFTASLNLQDGNPASSQFVMPDERIIRPADPTRTNYIFGGWYQDIEYTAAWDFDTDIVTSDITLYAKWTWVKLPPPTITWPTAPAITYGAALSTSTLSGGSTEYGSFAWTTPATIPTVSNSGYSVTFTPNATTLATYTIASTLTETVPITVNKAPPNITWPTASPITYGSALSASTLTGGSTEYGTFAWVIPATIPTVVNNGYSVVLTPNAATRANYNVGDGVFTLVAITVNKASAPTITWPTAPTITYGTALSAITLTGGSTEYGTFTWTAPATIPTVGNTGYSVTFTPSAATLVNYTIASTLTDTVAITVNKAPAPTITWPTASTVTVGETLASSVLSITSNAYGSFAWTTPATVPTADNSGYSVIFTPNAVTLANYEAITPLSQTVAVTVTVAPTYAVTVVTTGPGVSIGSYEAGATVTVNAGTAPAGKRFVRWGSTPAVTFANANSASTSFSMPSAAVTVTAVFEDIPAYAVTVSSAGTGATGSGSYEAGVIVSINSGTVPAGKQFVNWVSTPAVTFANANNSSTTFTMPASVVTVTAVFEDIPAYAVTVSSAGTGATGSGSYEAGVIVSINSGTVPAGKQFVNWVSTPAVTFANANNSSTTFTMPASVVTVTAVFEDIPAYAVTVSSAGTGATGSGNYEAGVVVSINAGTISDGQTFVKWVSSDSTVVFADANSPGTSFIMPAGAVTVTADFASAIQSRDRLIPPNDTGEETALVAPVAALTGKFIAGPNPAARSAGKVAFLRQGRRVEPGTLSIYDASGNLINKVKIIDNALSPQDVRRQVGVWDLKDGKGRLVSEGTYLVRGMVITLDGKRERVSVMVGVR